MALMIIGIIVLVAGLIMIVAAAPGGNETAFVAGIIISVIGFFIARAGDHTKK